MYRENDRINYIVKPEEGLVIGVFDVDEREDVWDRLFSQIPLDETFTIMNILHYNYNNNNFSIKAIAKCAEGDVFDEEFGKKLVEAKIYRKLHSYAIKRYNNAIKSMEKLSMRIQNERIRHEWKASRIEDDLKNYFGVEPPND